MSKARSRLPEPPTGKGSTRPLPPEPAGGGSEEGPPPPLPSRPAPHRGGSKIPPPPVRNGTAPAIASTDDYLEPDAWTDEGSLPPEPPRLPPRNFSPTPDSDDEQDTMYEEPEAPKPPPPVPQPPKHHPTKAAPPPQQQEIYDDLEGEDEPAHNDVNNQHNGYTQDEVYDMCDIEETGDEEPELYEVEPEPELPPPPPEQHHEEEDNGLYEYVPEAPVATAPPVAIAHHTRALPPPPTSSPIPPGLPKRPPASHGQKERPPSPVDDDAPVLPGRPSGAGTKAPIKKMSGDGPAMPGISLGDLSNKKANLKKVNSTEKKASEDKPDGAVTSEASEANSVRNRILKFKQAETGKPFLPVKPTMSNAPLNAPSTISSGSPISSRSLGPPPPPPTNSLPPQGSKQKMPDPPQPTPVRQAPPPATPSPPLSPRCESDDFYDDGMSYMRDPMEAHEWYHGELERQSSEEKLKSIGQDGTFMVRKSRQGGNDQPYTLVVLYQNHAYNLKIRVRPDKQVALGEVKPDEMAFKDVPALVSHHKTNDVILVNKKEGKQHTTPLLKFPVAVHR